MHGIDFDIGDREFCVLVGPSGCGKSTILRMIAGLESVSGGEVAINGRVVNDDAPRERDIAMVFQDYALYPHMSVRQNLGFGLKMRGAPRAEIAEAVAKTAEILQIQRLLDRRPKELSGGQRQRVAIGRAIARSPALFLFDEPLSNLDAKLRVEMRTQIKRLHMAFGATSVYVTHDQTEAMTLADRIVALRDGRIEQMGSPDDLYARPRQPLRRRLHRLADDELPAAPGCWRKATASSSCPTAARACRSRRPAPSATGRLADKPVVLGLRPEDLTNTWTEESRDGSGVGAPRHAPSRSPSRSAPTPSSSAASARRRSWAASARPPLPPSARRSACTPTSTACTSSTRTRAWRSDRPSRLHRDSCQSLPKS